VRRGTRLSPTPASPVKRSSFSLTTTLSWTCCNASLLERWPAARYHALAASGSTDTIPADGGLSSSRHSTQTPPSGCAPLQPFLAPALERSFGWSLVSARHGHRPMVMYPLPLHSWPQVGSRFHLPHCVPVLQRWHPSDRHICGFAVDLPTTLQVALLSMNATAVGLDFSCASIVVFAEIPSTVGVLKQAEARAHRAKATSAVNAYVLLCQRTLDVRAWLRLSESLERTSSLVEKGHTGARRISLPPALVRCVYPRCWMHARVQYMVTHGPFAVDTPAVSPTAGSHATCTSVTMSLTRTVAHCTVEVALVSTTIRTEAALCRGNKGSACRSSHAH
jgi:hypothetical protein